MANDIGFQDLPKIGREMSAAALVAGIAGVSRGLETTKNELKDNAPVGKGKINPRGNVTPGGRTKGSIGWAYPRVSIVSHGQFGAIADVEVTAVVAPQGIYHNDGTSAQTIRPRTQGAMVFLSGNQWTAIGPNLKSGTGTRTAGFSRAGLRTQFIKGDSVTRPAQPASRWMDNTADNFRPSLAASSKAFSRILSKAGRRPSTADVSKRAFSYNPTPGAWGSGYRHSKDQKWRNNWRSAANRAGGVWDNQVRAAIAKLRI